MASWSQFVAAAPELAARVRALLEQHGPGLGYLATVRPDGGPRVHPVAPVITDDGLYCFVIPSPKRRDLERDGRYALHTFPPADSDDEAYLTGWAAPVTDQVRAARLAVDHRAAPGGDWRLFELRIEVAMVGHAGPEERSYQTWRAGRAAPERGAPAAETPAAETLSAETLAAETLGAETPTPDEPGRGRSGGSVPGTVAPGAQWCRACV